MFLLVVVMVKRSKSGSKYHKCLKGGSLLGVVAAVIAVGWVHRSEVCGGFWLMVGRVSNFFAFRGECG